MVRYAILIVRRKHLSRPWDQDDKADAFPWCILALKYHRDKSPYPYSVVVVIFSRIPRWYVYLTNNPPLHQK